LKMTRANFNSIADPTAQLLAAHRSLVGVRRENQLDSV
jgi:hypothetical protein